MHERQSDLSGDGIWLCAESISIRPSGNTRYGLEDQEGLAFKVIRPQRVMVQNCHDEACPLSLALLQGHHTVTERRQDGERMAIKIHTRVKGET